MPFRQDSNQTLVRPHANNGMTVNCVRQPMRISFGRLSTILKSFAESVNPMPNIMMPNMGLITHVPIHASEEGTIRLSAATISTITPIHLAIKSQIRCILLTIQSLKFGVDCSIVNIRSHSCLSLNQVFQFDLRMAVLAFFESNFTVRADGLLCTSMNTSQAHGTMVSGDSDLNGFACLSACVV